MYIKTNTITLTAGTTYSPTWGELSTTNYQLVGSPNMASGNITINLPSPTGTGPDQYTSIRLMYLATPSNYDEATAYIIIEGEKLRAEWASKEVIIVCQFDQTANAWKMVWLPDFRQTSFIVSEMIVDGTIAAGDLGTDSVTTIKILDDNVTLPKIQNIADDTILGNISGSSASPVALDAEDVRTLLDQDVTLTGHVTGTATQTFATGDTSLSTTISNNTITVAMCTNTVNTDLVTIPISMETGALTAGSCYVAVKVPYACTVEEYGFSVTELIEATDDATITLYNTAGTLMGSSSITVTKNTKPSSSAAGGSFFNSSSITSNNSISTGNIFYVRVQKTTAGGKGFVNIKIKRA